MQDDTVRDVEATVLAQVLNLADHVAQVAAATQFVGEREIEGNDLSPFARDGEAALALDA